MEEEVTTTAFLASVTQGEPFRFQAMHAQIRSALRITHLVFVPPSEQHHAAASSSSSGASLAASAGATFALIQTLSGPHAAVAATTVAGFRHHRAADQKSGAVTVEAAGGGVSLALRQDIAAGLNIQLDVDEFTELQVQGPGTVLFFGEQFSQLIDEELNHRMFDDEEMDDFDDDEEYDDDDDDDDVDLDEMLDLARD